MGQQGEAAYRKSAWPWLAAFAAIALLLPLQTALPPPWVLFALTMTAFCLLAQRSSRGLGWLLMALLLVVSAYARTLADRLEPGHSGQLTTLTGTVSSLPEQNGKRLRFRLTPDINPQGKRLPHTVLVHWYRDWPDVRHGEGWRLEARLKPPWGLVNLNGPDRERWLFANRIGAVASVRSGERIDRAAQAPWSVQDAREAVRDSINRELPDTQGRAAVLALAIADRSAIDRERQHLFRVTGTAHLMAISGLHVGLATMGGLFLGRYALGLLPAAGHGLWVYRTGLAFGAASAVAYAMLAGLGISTVRAVLMSLAGLFALSVMRSVHPLGAFILALAIVLLTSPLAPLGAGFWYSFIAVLALLLAFVPRPWLKSWWKVAVLAQAAVFVVAAPVNVSWLGGVSLNSFGANLLAIPWVSVLVVPAVLAGVVMLPLSESLAGVSWWFAAGAMDLLLAALGQVAAGLPGIWPVAGSSPLLGVGAVLGGVLLLLPKGLPGRWLGLFLLAPLFLPVATVVPSAGLRIEALDSGQGSAIVLATRHHTLLYDTGAGDGEGNDSVQSVIVPALTSMGRAAPDRVVISHGDLDHAGGLFSLRERYPGLQALASARPGTIDVTACHKGISWRHDRHRFETLHPSTGLPYLRNDSSCVVAVEGPGARILLPGDIGGGVENRLLLDGVQPHDVLFAPHHGSAGSSSRPFIERVAPRIAIATAGLGNRFGFPRPEVRQRYAEQGIDLWATGECGGIRLDITKEGEITATSARKQKPRIWRWPAAPNCP